jgi:hypothetical protein
MPSNRAASGTVRTAGNAAGAVTGLAVCVIVGSFMTVVVTAYRQMKWGSGVKVHETNRYLAWAANFRPLPRVTLVAARGFQAARVSNGQVGQVSNGPATGHLA